MSVRTTARFDISRRQQLKDLFTRKRLCELWRTLVRDQMRTFDITDLHDYYDFNYAIEARADAIAERVLAGQYRADAPLIYRLEKKLGICRHMMIPSPSDVLVFQLLSDALYPAVVKAQPSQQAFYARVRHALKLPHEHKDAASYPWFVLWPKFQKEIWKFSDSFAYLVTTDLTNYFDSIGLRELRHVISAIVETKEVHLDLLFSLIEDLSWKPDYLPISHTGLPTINIEAPRLLAHALLFEVDSVLKERTADNFVRWMDDINFGVNEISSAKRILAEVSDVLKSRGLALNLSKTEVLTAREAYKHFLIRENQHLTELHDKARKAKTAKVRKRMSRSVAKELSIHLDKCSERNKDKITKRYLTVLGTLGVAAGLESAQWIYRSQPSMRQGVLRYVSSLPFSSAVSRTFIKLYDDTELYDDATRFGFASAVVDWAVPHTARGINFVLDIGRRLRSNRTPFEWLCWLVFLAKYGTPTEILDTALREKKLAAKEPFIARQRITVLTRCLGTEPKLVIKEWRAETAAGYPDSASVASNLLKFASESFPLKKSRLYPYLFPPKPQRTYPLPKFLLLCDLGYSEKLSRKAVRRPEVTAYVTCPWYIHWLKGIHGYWF